MRRKKRRKKRPEKAAARTRLRNRRRTAKRTRKKIRKKTRKKRQGQKTKKKKQRPGRSRRRPAARSWAQRTTASPRTDTCPRRGPASTRTRRDSLLPTESSITCRRWMTSISRMPSLWGIPGQSACMNTGTWPPRPPSWPGSRPPSMTFLMTARSWTIPPGGKRPRKGPSGTCSPRQSSARSISPWASMSSGSPTRRTITRSTARWSAGSISFSPRPSSISRASCMSQRPRAAQTLSSTTPPSCRETRRSPLSPMAGIFFIST